MRATPGRPSSELRAHAVIIGTGHPIERWRRGVTTAQIRDLLRPGLAPDIAVAGHAEAGTAAAAAARDRIGIAPDVTKAVELSLVEACGRPGPGVYRPGRR